MRGKKGAHIKITERVWSFKTLRGGEDRQPGKTGEIPNLKEEKKRRGRKRMEL